MRILVYEFVSAGGFGNRDIPSSLVPEGTAMLGALCSDLATLGRHAIVTTIDPRFRAAVQVPPVVEIRSTPPRRADVTALFSSVEALWLIAPEIGGCLERLALCASQVGVQLLGSDTLAVGKAANKARLAKRLETQGIPHPRTCLVRSDAQCRAAARDLGYPLIVKPVRGAGCVGVTRVAHPRELASALHRVRSTSPRGPLLLQTYVRGPAASVSLLADGQRVKVLSVNRQLIRTRHGLSYVGGVTDYRHPLAARAAENAARACEALADLKGFVGVDLVLTRDEAVVIEVNPRLTTAYLGLRRAMQSTRESQVNVAGLVLDACAGRLPNSLPPLRGVRFFADGRTVVEADRLVA